VSSVLSQPDAEHAKGPLRAERDRVALLPRVCPMRGGGSVGAQFLFCVAIPFSNASYTWTLVAAVAIGYMVSRGLAKSGTAYRDRDRD
jgi:hypothetical protein